ncbi:hypothetical protein H9L05_12625 [Hymenobacter qilianensis]|uniref:Uncharacterized protein n=1 Tax=Hymenobacter qilianensis TaxID=1385715 RepID=A0A7H0GRR4_9BACT|nr:hypothetical protein [Hymenobacter qilianensis]QNP50980.1 hypothetical protein H9L05_12625 [Hymenobacter qilianensis]
MDPDEPLDLFAQKTDAELFFLARQAQRFPPAVVQAAVRELQRRGLVPAEAPRRPLLRPHRSPTKAPAACCCGACGRCCGRPGRSSSRPCCST